MTTGVAASLPQPRIAMTANGIGLARRAKALRAAGPDRINVSLDTLDPMRFAEITRRDRAGRRARRAGRGPRRRAHPGEGERGAAAPG
jgi:molybdenum cofactor biosynthesis enzyme MoaA